MMVIGNVSECTHDPKGAIALVQLFVLKRVQRVMLYFANVSQREFNGSSRNAAYRMKVAVFLTVLLLNGNGHAQTVLVWQFPYDSAVVGASGGCYTVACPNSSDPGTPVNVALAGTVCATGSECSAMYWEAWKAAQGTYLQVGNSSTAQCWTDRWTIVNNWQYATNYGAPSAVNQTIQVQSGITRTTRHYTCDGTLSSTTNPGVQVNGAVRFVAIQVPAEYFVVAVPSKDANCGLSCNGVGHPINPNGGAVYDSLADFKGPAGSVAFKRFYNSADETNGDYGIAWRHTFIREIQPKDTTASLHPYVEGNSDYSSRYASEASACTGGFAELKSRVATWSNAVVSYSTGNCAISSGGTYLGSLSIHKTGGSLSTAPTSVAYDAIRDDGQVIRFSVINGVTTAPAGTSLKLSQTASGFTVIDGNDNVETYDTAGKLLSITSRTGVVQTMSYDGSGRLSGVADNFGRQLMFGYDAQNKLISVTRQ